MLKVGGIEVAVSNKDVKNLHLSVLPPDGRVRVTAPLSMKDEAILLSVVNRLSWIKKRISEFDAQDRQTSREYVSGETHYYLGQNYKLKVIKRDKKGGRVEVKPPSDMILQVPAGCASKKREEIMQTWYRNELREILEPLIQKWEKKLNVDLEKWGIKKMKTQWGSCNSRKSQTWFNLELIKKPHRCIEYVVVHELLHLKEDNHNEEFVRLMEENYPQWRERKKELNELILAHEEW
jgi:hypothetical protein